MYSYIFCKSASQPAGVLVDFLLRIVLHSLFPCFAIFPVCENVKVKKVTEIRQDVKKALKKISEVSKEKEKKRKTQEKWKIKRKYFYRKY